MIYNGVLSKKLAENKILKRVEHFLSIYLLEFKMFNKPKNYHTSKYKILYNLQLIDFCL